MADSNAQALRDLADAHLAAILKQLPTDQIVTFADDSTLTAAILDRLLHHAHVIQIKEENYHLKDKRKGGIIKARQPAESTAEVGQF